MSSVSSTGIDIPREKCAQSTPLCAYRQGDIVAWRRGEPISRELFLTHVEQIARQLPDKPYAVNLCEDRYLFLVTFCAALTRGQTNLLPNSRLGKAVDACVNAYIDHYRITDRHIDQAHYALEDGSAGSGPGAVPSIAADHTAAVIFTSGSTGHPRPHPQRWGDLSLRARIIRGRLAVDSRMTIVATVPAQHMYGLETSILLPLVSAASTDASRPFFPHDVRDTLCSMPVPRVLVTTPIHLRACLDSELEWPDIELVLSATAPLSRSLAERAERCFRGPLLEIYGSTETGAIATRRTTAEDLWQPCECLSFRRQSGEVWVIGAQLPEETLIPDKIEFAPDGRFRLLGRRSDLVNIAGKRGSLSDLTQKLMAIDGVQDAALIAADEQGQPLPRLCALIVAPGRSRNQILRALAELVDPVFLPRPLYMVSALGRSECGKLPIGHVWALLKSINEKRDSGR
jgi:acyl-coenzyme A synthetase/AMP-(fatty) acid ligase